ncbi:MAG: A24 family peptidase, partial [Deltaproteobacteria bacterium]|nr:A24 family peptidase [Deltaproteobacteria bacterium]
HHFVLEVATAALALLAFSRLEPWPRFLIYLLLFIAPVLLLIVVDWRCLILPNAITLPGIAAGFLVHWVDGKFFPVTTMHLSSLSLLLESFYGAAAGGLTLGLLAFAYQSLRKRPGLGMGDVKFAAMLGAFFGWKAIFFIFFAASILGIVVGGILILFRRQSLDMQLPFGSALGVVSLLFLFLGERMVQAYFHALRHLL